MCVCEGGIAREGESVCVCEGGGAAREEEQRGRGSSEGRGAVGEGELNV